MGGMVGLGCAGVSVDAAVGGTGVRVGMRLLSHGDYRVGRGHCRGLDLRRVNCGNRLCPTCA